MPQRRQGWFQRFRAETARREAQRDERDWKRAQKKEQLLKELMEERAKRPRSSGPYERMSFNEKAWECYLRGKRMPSDWD